ncbi:MAG: thiamine pyrophosphate-binding protein [bacterium]
MRVADYIADFIAKLGVRHVFMMSGGGSIYLDDGIACNKKIMPVCVRNEATAPMMAEAYSRLNQNLGVVYVTTGPGGANAVSGLAEAWVDSAPILIISGQVNRKYASYNSKIKNLRNFGTQEINIIEIVRSITKYAEMINDPDSIRYHLEKAIYLAKSGRPGPVWLDIPLDIQSAMVDESKLRCFVPEEKQISLDLDTLINKVLKLLQNAKKPLIIAGQGIRISRAIPEFKSLVELLSVPVIFSRLGQDILPFSYKNNFGHGGTKGLRFTGKIMEESDLIISIGSRLAVPFVGEKLDVFSDTAKVVMVDIDEAELAKPAIKIDLPIKIDAKLFIVGLSNKLKNARLQDYKNWLSVCQEYKNKYPLTSQEQKKDPIDLYYFVSRLDALSSEKNIFVSDAGSSYYVAGQALTFEKGQREITSGAFASMGLSISLAIGCCFANKNAQVLAITGDGSLELNIQELKTMSYYDLEIKLFVINNGGYVSIRNTQDKLCDGRYINSDQANCEELLDFKKIAEAFDLPYFLIEKQEEIDEKVFQIMKQKGPAFVEVVCDNKQKIIEPIKA